jgi:23S rRNA (uracil1939-C5)-methyltransferase
VGRFTTLAGEVMVILVFREDDESAREGLFGHLLQEFPGISSLMYMINLKPNDSTHDLAAYLYSGQDHLTEIMDGLRYRIGPKSFFQTNTLQALKLYRLVKEYAQLSGNETVYDLYTGAGTIANFLASLAGKVIGIEYIGEAVSDARLNAGINGISNAVFVAGDIKDVMDEAFMAEHGRPEVLITDPPRAGMHPDVVQAILDAAPGRIIYVSCNPATQARDIALLSERYSLQIIQPIDMFPHTYHVESIAVLDLQ